ncbi:metallophosphoesterase [Salinicola aestuarinus]|uniref:metallophosphoesterase n=1 Tax=Salinicola aestuarinus TaxID=1949082 RepID=UPI000DA171E2|nr:metallophosphoesterase [Salinicola aestuarinus]
MTICGGLDGYDLIGDVHGCGRTLAALLGRLGYVEHEGIYRHPRRKVIFLGDLIDRGPSIRLAVSIARRMVEAGEAHIVMGNHEYNAIANAERPAGSPPSRIMRRTHEQFRDHPREWAAVLDWFRQLPLCLERDGLRVVHACWDEALIDAFLARCPDGRIDRAFLIEARERGSFAHRVLDVLTRGVQLPLPDGMSVRSANGVTRRAFRTHFWCRNPRTYGDVVFQPDALPGTLEGRLLGAQERKRLVWYPESAPPLFVGHYWCRGVPALVRANIACLDYSAIDAGRLVAYRWSGETELTADRFVWARVDARMIATGGA